MGQKTFSFGAYSTSECACRMTGQFRGHNTKFTNAYFRGARSKTGLRIIPDIQHSNAFPITDIHNMFQTWSLLLPRSCPLLPRGAACPQYPLFASTRAA